VLACPWVAAEARQPWERLLQFPRVV